MRNARIFGIFILLLGTALVLAEFDRLPTRLIRVIPDGFSITADWLPQKDRLTRLESLSRVLYYVKENYYDPKRIDPSRMFEKALENVSQMVPEVRILRPDPRKIVLAVDRERLEFDKNIPNLYALHSVMSDALRFVRTHKKNEIIEKDLETASISGLLSTLDPHTVYMPEEVYTDTRADIAGTFGGLGIIIEVREGKLTIVAPLDGTPADRAGLKAADLITKIGEESTTNMSVHEAVKKMRGPKGTSITISVLRAGWASSKDFLIVRDEIKVVSVDSQLLPGEVGYVRIKSFQEDPRRNENTTRDLVLHLKKLTKEAAGTLKGVVLDLRNNPGGSFEQSVGVADKFLNDGTIVTRVGSSHRAPKIKRALAAGTEPDYPLVVLVNEGSASASEIVAGALQRLNRAIVMGRRTFGKGSVQSIYDDLPENSALKLTTDQYLTPGDFSIQTIGIVPDVLVIPASVTKERLDIFPTRRHFGEAGLEHHLDRPGEPNAPAESTLELHYLETRTDREISESASVPSSAKGPQEERLKKYLGDFEIRTALEFVRAAGKKVNRQGLLATAASAASDLNKQEATKIVRALDKKGIDWSPAPATEEKGCTAPKATARIVGKPSAPVTAGDKVRYEVSLENRGGCTLYQAWALTQSKNYLFNDREFLFGKISPGGTVRRDVEIEIPKATPTNMSLVEIQFQEARNHTPPKLEHSVAIRNLPTPRFAFHHDIVPAISKEPGGKSFELRFWLKNIGDVATSEASASLRPIPGEDVRVRRGHVPLLKMAPGEVKDSQFVFDVARPFANGSVIFDLTFAETTYQIYLHKQITIPIEMMSAARPHKSPATRAYLVPPKIDFDSEKFAFDLARNQFLRITGNLSDDDAIRDFYVFVNRKKVLYQSFATGGVSPSKQTFDAVIPIEPGINRVLLVTTDSSELRDQRAFLLARPGETPEEKKAIAATEEATEEVDLFLMDPTAP